VPGGSRRASAAAAAAGDSVSLSVRRWDELEKAVREQVGDGCERHEAILTAESSYTVALRSVGSLYVVSGLEEDRSQRVSDVCTWLADVRSTARERARAERQLPLQEKLASSVLPLSCVHTRSGKPP
jgi:hypothetical protein